MARFMTPVPHFEDNNDAPLVAGNLYFYEAGTATPKTTYSDSALTTANTNPVVLNARGEPDHDIFASDDSLFKAVLKTSAGVTLWERDNVRFASTPLTNEVLVINTIADLQANTETLSSVVNVLGFYAVGDGGGDFWKQDASADADDGGVLCVVDAASVRWKRSNPYLLNHRKIGCKSDAVVSTTTVTGTDSQPIIRTWLSSALRPRGAVLELEAGSFYIKETNQTGGAMHLAETGVYTDGPDLICILALKQRHFTIRGAGGEWCYNRGYCFMASLCEDFDITGISVRMPSNRWTTQYPWGVPNTPITLEPAAIYIWYSHNFRVNRNRIWGSYRGIQLARNAAAEVRGNYLFGTNYMGIVSYGDFSVPAGMTVDGTAFDPQTFFDVEAARISSGTSAHGSAIVIDDNYVYYPSWIGIMLTGRGVVSNNRVNQFKPPSLTGATIMGHYFVHGGNTQLMNNHAFNVPDDFLRGVGDPTNPVVIIGAQMTNENATTPVHAGHCSGNRFENVVVGISVSRCKGAIIDRNVLLGVTLTHIDIQVNANSEAKNIRITSNHLGKVDTATVRATSFSALGGIVSTGGTADTHILTGIVANGNTAAMELDSIVDATTKAAWKTTGISIKIPGPTVARPEARTLRIRDNDGFDGGDSGGEIINIWNETGIYAGSRIVGQPRAITATDGVTTYQMATYDNDDVLIELVPFTNTTYTLNLPIRTRPGQRFHFVTKGQAVWNITRYDPTGYTLHGQSDDWVLNASAAADSIAEVLMVAKTNNTSNVYDMTVYPGGGISGGTSDWL